MKDESRLDLESMSEEDKVREFTRLLDAIDWADIPRRVWMPEGNPLEGMEIPHLTVAPEWQHLGRKSALIVVPDEMDREVSARIYYDRR